MPENPENPEGESSALEEWKRVATLSVGLSSGGVVIAVGVWVGYKLGGLLDGKLGLSNVFATIFPILGFLGGMVQMWRMLKMIQGRSEK